MEDNQKTKKQLIEELNELRKCVAELKDYEAEIIQVRVNQEKFTKAFLQNSIPAVITTLKEGRFVDVSDVFLRLIGRKRDEVVGHTLTDIGFITEDQRASFFNDLNKRGRIENLEMEVSTKGGVLRWGLFNAVMMSLKNEKYLLTVMIDITARKQAEEALEKSEEKFRLISENMLDCVALVDTDGTYQYVTPSYRETLGYDPEDMVGIEGFSLTHPDDLERVTRLILEGIEQGGRETGYETRLRHKDGHYVSLEIRVRALNDPQGKIVGGVLCARDITKRKQMEADLLRAHKLESLGVLAGGIAHDFNNLMTIVQGYIDLALMDLPSGHVSHQRLLTAMRSVDQTKDLASRLITFSRGGGPHREFFDVTEIIRDAVHRTVKGTDVKVTFDFMENLWPAEVDELQMKQVFYNLTKNAVAAMPEGGNLTIQAENALIPAGDVLDLKEGSYLKIRLADEGIGIPEDLLAKVFDPYFTTKKMGVQKGLGLGLAVCYSVLKKHDGHITVKSPPGEGAAFVLYLPARADLAKEKEVKKIVSTGRVRVLIMDDEPHIREIERAYLEQMGYQVTEVKDGQEAIDTHRKALVSSNPFDLVILDLTVRQGLGGRLAMERLLEIDPAIRAIIVSGYVDDPVIEHYGDYGFQGALKKPFKREEMKNLVEKIIHG